MATAEQIKLLIRSHFSGEEEQFCSASLQIAACEAHKGRQNFADDIRAMVKKGQTKTERKPVAAIDNLAVISEPKSPMTALVLQDHLHNSLDRILQERRQVEKLARNGFENRRKLLMAGPPGTGKTLTASVLAAEMGIPLYNVMVDQLVTRYLGETSAKLRKIFDFMPANPGVYLFDEFDSIGGDRSSGNDVGEMRRVLNAFLQFLEIDRSSSFIVAATNNPRILDPALFRRFDDILYYRLPEAPEISQLIKSRLGTFGGQITSNSEVIEICDSLSHAQIVKAVDNAIKIAIIDDLAEVPQTILIQELNEIRSSFI